MLRLVLEWFSTNRNINHFLSFDETATWFSEARLASTFLPRRRGDKQAEGYTHADGVIGHFKIGSAGQSDLTVLRDATELKVVEAKMFSKLSKGTTHAPRYNQAARNVACIAEILQIAKRKPDELQSLGFYVLAPKEQIDAGVFGDQLEKQSLEEVVWERVDGYEVSGDEVPKEVWFKECFLPTLERIETKCISWEDVTEFVATHDPAFGRDLKEFYSLCLRYNRPQ